ncbi:hypothetical protein [Corynebacterium ulcerans]|nr:hypothetical protein [Corynebacterium ulcerans]
MQKPTPGSMQLRELMVLQSTPLISNLDSTINKSPASNVAPPHTPER